ncbi:hypothetical protein [Bdellovibrio sp. HCB2-146]|uniref:hypothetical protein n=1 Tax=Bdellovibrio sp. HCB2-146 TaxID=3394362 RepID=UPI0039BD1AEE
MESFTGKFKLTEIEKVQTQCLFNEKGLPLSEQPLFVEQKGCILTWELVQITKGKAPEENKTASWFYSIYDSGSKCKTKIGTLVTQKIESTDTECCGEFERSLHSKAQNCYLQPKIHLVAQPTEKYIRCSSKGGSWKVVN